MCKIINEVTSITKHRPHASQPLEIFYFEENDDFNVLEFYGAFLLEGNTLKVNEDDLVDYINATILFWDEMPEKAFAEADLVIEALNK